MIFEVEPIDESIRKAGFGGVNRYEEYNGYNNSELVIETKKKIDKLNKQLFIQSKSFDEVIELANNKATMLSCIPAIQPISNEKEVFFNSMGVSKRWQNVCSTLSYCCARYATCRFAKGASSDKSRHSASVSQSAFSK